MPITTVDSLERVDRFTSGHLALDLPAGDPLRVRVDAEGTGPGLLVVLGACPPLPSASRTPTLTLADPTPVPPDAPGDWFTGVPGAGLQDALARVVRHAVALTGRRPVVVGCGAGGFAALDLARRLDGASAVVWHAATSVLGTPHAQAAALLTSWFGGDWDGAGWRERAAGAFDAAGIAHDLGAAGLPEALFWLQDATPARLRAQVTGFLDAHGFEGDGRGLLRAGETRGVLLGRFGVEPRADLLDRAVAAHLSGATDATATALALDAAGARAGTDPAALPVDLRPRADAGGFEVAAHVWLDRCHARVTGPGLAWPALDFVWRAMGEEGPVARGTTTQPVWTHVPGDAVRRVVCTVRDGFGHPLAQVDAIPDRTTAEKHANHVFILGSCVSRDAFALEGMPRLAHYAARTSLATSFDPRPSGLEDADLSANPSAFQRRMVAADLRRELPDELAEPTYGWVLVDLIDERFDLARGPGGGLVSLSMEALDAGIGGLGLPVHPAGSSAHLAGFTRGWRSLCDLVGQERIIVNRAYWATVDTDGVPLPDQEAIAAGNALMDELYRIVRRVSPRVRWLRYPRELFVADPGHRWGQAAFHYAPAFYEATREQLTAVVRSGRRRRRKEEYLERRERVVAELNARRAERLARVSRRSGGPASPA